MLWLFVCITLSLDWRRFGHALAVTKSGSLQDISEVMTQQILHFNRGKDYVKVFYAIGTIVDCIFSSLVIIIADTLLVSECLYITTRNAC